MSANPVRLAAGVLSGRKPALTSVITFFELDKACCCAHGLLLKCFPVCLGVVSLFAVSCCAFKLVSCDLSCCPCSLYLQFPVGRLLVLQAVSVNPFTMLSAFSSGPSPMP